MNLLNTITQLSHEFGTADYVQGGGGNASAKDAQTLWIKPSGTTLADLTPDRFVPIERHLLEAFYTARVPPDSAHREALVKNMLAAAVFRGATGRPSVETPLHDSFKAAFVIHTHPARVNGMTCARGGEAVCGKLFPDALWIPYTDPGYTLCVRVRAEIQAWRSRTGTDPALVFLQNHGVFVAAETAREMRRLYKSTMATLNRAYAETGVPNTLSVSPAPTPERVAQVAHTMREVVGVDQPIHVVASGFFPVPAGPFTPDHIVYMKSLPLLGEATPAALRAFIERHGYWPRAIAAPDAVFAAGTTPRNAALALAMAQDGAMIAQCTEAFGGAVYLSEPARDFIDHWEAEQYRRGVT